MECLLEMGASDDGYWVFRLHVCVCLSTGQTSAIFFGGNCVSDGGFGSALAELGDISASEVLSEFGHEVERDVGGNGRLAKHGLEDVLASTLVRKRDVDELVQTAWADQGLVENIWSVGCTDEEKIFLDSCTVHLSQQLVQDSV